MEQFKEIDTSLFEMPQGKEDLYENRSTFAVSMRQKGPEATVLVTAYNRLEKTKRCVESILAHTTRGTYELFLIDNGSTDGTLEYFQSIDYEYKKILHITKNVGAGFPSTQIALSDLRDYVAILADDNIVTEHWLDNLLTCIKSDPKIGMVTPVGNNMSNLQTVELKYSSFEEMQEKAADYNVSDPKKWEERLRLITLGTLYRKEVLLAIGWPIGDAGFAHNFMDDDASFTIRRAGYRTILAGDTWICHDHLYEVHTKEEYESFQENIEIGRQNFRCKYHGLDAWDDVNNFLKPHLRLMPDPECEQKARILGIDVKCGTPMLDLKNWLRSNNVYDTSLSAFTRDAKYWLDLKSICEGEVVCDREEYFPADFKEETFDYVVIDRAVNLYHNPQKLLKEAFALCKRGGCVICKLKNTSTYVEFANALGRRDLYDTEYAKNITVEATNQYLKQFGSIEMIVPVSLDVEDRIPGQVNELLPDNLEENEKKELLFRMLCGEFIFVTKKN